MPTLAELFNPSVFIGMGILVLIVSALIYYIQHILREYSIQQNEKLTSMFSLVSSLAEEVNYTKTLILNIQDYTNSENKTANLETFKNFSKNNNELMSVSDDDESDVTELRIEDEYDINESDPEENENDDENDDDDIDSLNNTYNIINWPDEYDITSEITSNNNKNNDIKFLKLNLNQFIETTVEEPLTDDDICLDESPSDDDTKETENVEKTDLSDAYINDKLFPKSETILEIESSDLKNIKLNLEETVATSLDYKKQGLSKLRQLVIDQGLSIDAKKLKKEELLKLLKVV
jgi:hypothetical protein